MFPVDSAEMRVIIPIIDDDIAEDTESFMVSLSNPSNAVINDNQNHTVVWITDTGDCEYNNYNALYAVHHDHTNSLDPIMHHTHLWVQLYQHTHTHTLHAHTLTLV